MVGGLEAEDQEALLAGAGAGHAGLGRVEQAAVARIQAGLGDLADGSRGSEEVVELDPARGLELGPRADPHPGLGDRPEDALGAEQRPVRRGPGAGARQPPALPQAAWRDRPHRLDQVVDVRVERREMPARPGRDPTAQGRVLERLREVPQGQPALAQLLLQTRPGRPRLDPRRQRLRVDLQHPVQPPQVERHERPIPEPPLDPADDTRPAAERDHGRALGLAPGQHRLDLRLVPRQRHQIGRIRELPPKPPHNVPIRLPQRPAHALVLLIREQIPKPARLRQPRLAHLDRIERHSPLRLAPKPKPLPYPGSSLLQLLPRRRLILVPPPPVLQPSLTHVAKHRRRPVREGQGVSLQRSGVNFSLERWRVPPRERAKNPARRRDTPCPSPCDVYQCTPFIRCAKATASVVGARSGASSPFPLAACDSGNSLYAVLRILSLTVGATA